MNPGQRASQGLIHAPICGGYWEKTIWGALSCNPICNDPWAGAISVVSFCTCSDGHWAKPSSLIPTMVATGEPPTKVFSYITTCSHLRFSLLSIYVTTRLVPSMGFLHLGCLSDCRAGLYGMQSLFVLWWPLSRVFFRACPDPWLWWPLGLALLSSTDILIDFI
jgi:hypothetical protein